MPVAASAPAYRRSGLKPNTSIMGLGYWEGYSQAKVDVLTTPASWHQHNVRYAKERLEVINNVFEFWYRCRINNTSYQSSIDRVLNEAGRTGTGMDELEHVFRHLEINGAWSDKYADLSTYWSGPDALFFPNPIDLPVAIKNFVEIIDKKLTALRQPSVDFHVGTQHLEHVIKRNDWRRIGEVLKELHTCSSRAKWLMWASPSSRRRVKRFTSFEKALSAVYAGMTSAVDNRSAAVGMLRMAVSYVPVLGSYYGSMVDMLPNTKNWFTGLIDEYCKRLDAAAAGHLRP